MSDEIKQFIIKTAVLTSQRITEKANHDEKAFKQLLVAMLPNAKAAVDEVGSTPSLAAYQVQLAEAQLVKLAEVAQLLRALGPLLISLQDIDYGEGLSSPTDSVDPLDPDDVAEMERQLSEMLENLVK